MVLTCFRPSISKNATPNYSRMDRRFFVPLLNCGRLGGLPTSLWRIMEVRTWPSPSTIARTWVCLTPSTGHQRRSDSVEDRRICLFFARSSRSYPATLGLFSAAISLSDPHQKGTRQTQGRQETAPAGNLSQSHASDLRARYQGIPNGRKRPL
jgi:hypothetical protein